MEEYILYPNLMSREELLELLKNRHLSIPNLEQLPIDQLKNIYSKFALPLSSRDTNRKSNNVNNFNGNASTTSTSVVPVVHNYVTQHSSNSKCNRISIKRNISELETNSDTAYNNKIIKLNNCNNTNLMSTEIQLKRFRKNVDDIKNLEQNLDQCQQQLKRQKITWP